MKRFLLSFLIITLSVLPSFAYASQSELGFYSKQLGLSIKDTVELIKYADDRGVEFSLVYGLLSVETGGSFDHDAIGPPVPAGKRTVHAYGMAQFMENTAPWIANKGGLPYKGKENLFDAKYSIKLAIIYLSYLQYGDNKTHFGYHNWHASLTAYNRGMKGYESYKKKNRTTVSAYSVKVLERKY